MRANPIDRFEIRALQQHNDIRETIEELKAKVVDFRANLDPNRKAGEHLLAASLASIGS